MVTEKKEKEIILFISLIFLSLIFLGLDKLQWLNWLKRPIENLTNPIKREIYGLRSKIYDLRSEKLDPLILQQKADHLERENAEILVKLNDLEKENSSLKKLLGAPLPANWKFIPAKVLSIKEGIMTINKGFDDGIKENQTALVDNIVIGRIIKVNPKLSRLMLLAHKESNIKVKVNGIEAKAIIKGNDNTLILDEVLQEVKLQKGQIVVTTGEEEIYPASLIIGKIEEIEKNETAVYQKAVINPLVDYNTLEEVFIVKN